ncbi:MAG: DUF3467 domain-containing protein [Chloroflexi bacterium]|nr:DUF3467 domain-containing protein [Chloroflexota bacterium]
MTNIPPHSQRQLKIEVPPDLEPTYVNMARISHSPAEIIMDFACILPGDDKTTITSRMLMSPLGAKLFLRALGENLTRYETIFGEIKLPGDSSLANNLFRNIIPPDKEE